MNSTITLAANVATAAEVLLAEAITAVRPLVLEGGKLSAEKLEAEQAATHGLAWLSTYVETLRQVAQYADRMSAAGRFGPTEDLLARIGIGEYCAQILGGIAISQGEIVRLEALGLPDAAIAAFRTSAVRDAIATGNTKQNRAALVATFEHAHDGIVGDLGMDETLTAMRDEMRKF